MKKKIITFLTAMIFCSCSNSKEENFLANFIDKEKFESKSRVIKKINNEDLYFVNKAEAVNEFEFETGKEYYYGYKTKISNDCYLLLYGYQYHIDSNFHTFALGIAGKSYFVIYKKGEGIVSKLKVTTNDPSLSWFEEKAGIYTIKSISAYLKYDELKDGFFPCRKKDTIISKYKIENNRFVEIK